MKNLPLLLATLLMAPCAFAQTVARATPVDSDFEHKELVPASDFLPAAFLNGPHHTVAADAANDGLRNRYYITTHDREIELTGTPETIERIREIYAIEYLRGVSRRKEFTKAVAASGKAKVSSAAGLVRDPVNSLRRAPQGASRFFGRIGESMKGGASDNEDGALKGLTGVTASKVKLASQLGVNPYTANEELQQELTSVARAMAGGGLVVEAALTAVGGPAGQALSLVGVNQTLQDVLTNSTPEDLRIRNRKKLLALGVDRALADEFLMHPWYSPWHETIITEALAAVGVNPTAYLQDAVRALTPEDAFFFQRVAQILARYHTAATPIRAIRFDGGIITALDRNGTLMVPVSLDYAIWTSQVAGRVEEFAAIDRTRDEIKALALWTDGQLSERFCSELSKRQITYQAVALAESKK